MRFARRACILSLLLALPALGQTSANLVLSVSPNADPVRMNARNPLGFSVSVDNVGPSEARNVVVAVSGAGEVRFTGGAAGVTCAGMVSLRCTASTLAVGARTFLSFIYIPPPSNATQLVNFSVSSDTPDPFPANNTVTVAVEVRTGALVRLFFPGLLYRLDPSAKTTARVDVINVGFDAARGVTVTAKLPTGGTFVDARGRPEDTCAVEPDTVVCTAGELRYGQFTLEFTIAAPERLTGGKMEFTATVDVAEGGFDNYGRSVASASQIYRHLIVDNTDDDGPGSLRQVLRDVNDHCDDDICRVVFDLPAPPPESGWTTIRPLTPLPAITAANVIIDGTTQTAIGDTNANGPEVELRGDLLTEGDGLTLFSRCDASVLGLAINGFPGHGILRVGGTNLSGECATGAIRQISGNYIGTDATGSAGVPNGRGIVMSIAPVVSFFWWDTTISDNVISANRFSGIFIVGGGAIVVYKNKIGTGVDGTTPLGNGRSGIYAGHVAYTDIVNNVIANNAEFGIGLDAGAHAMFYDNAVVNNGLLGVDYGLDLVTPNSPDDRNRAPNAPVLESARFDVVSGKTIVRGHAESAPLSSGYFPTWAVELSASDSLNARGLAQGERPLRAFQVSAAKGSDFELVVDGDLTGKIITALLTRSSYIGFAKPESHDSFFLSETSEFSNPVRVEP